jgi:hypothetical protein
MKKVVWLALLVAIFPFIVCAQETPSAEVSVGYSYFRVGGTGGTNQNGGSASIAFNVNTWVGAVGDFGGYHSSPFGVSTNNYTFLFGPRFSYRSSENAVPFAQVLFGGIHSTAGAFGLTASNNAFAYSFGGGVDFKVAPHLAFRPQADFIGIHSNGSNANCARITAALVFRFGQR